MTKKKKELDRIIVTNPMIGLCYMQCCAVKDATDEEVLTECNRKNLCGTTNGWVHVYRIDEKLLKEGEKSIAPIVCGDDPDRLHLIISC